MSYDYETEKAYVCSEAGQQMFLAIRDNVRDLLKSAGAISMGHATKCATGDSWKMMACVDRLLELGEIKEVHRSGSVPGQYRIFVDPKE